MAQERDTTERELNMLKAIHGGATIEEVAERSGVSTTTVENWRKDLKKGIDFLDSHLKVDFRRGGKMDTTVHPIFLPANLSEVYTLLVILHEYSESHQSEPKAIIADEIVGKVHYQLTPYARRLVDRALKESGLTETYDVKPDFQKDDKGGREPTYLVMLEKSGAEVRIVYVNEQGDRDSVRGKLSCKCPSAPGRVRVEPFSAPNGESDLEIEYDKILFVERLD